MRLSILPVLLLAVSPLMPAWGDDDENHGIRITAIAFSVNEKLVSALNGEGLEDHELYRDLEDRVKNGEARVAYRISIHSRSGQRAKVKTGEKIEYPKTFEFDTKSEAWEVKETESAESGTVFEVDPVLGPKSQLIDVNFALTHQIRPPEDVNVTRRDKSGKEVVIGTTKTFFPEEVLSQVTCATGKPALVAVTTPHTVDPFSDPTERHLIFVRATTVVVRRDAAE